MHRKPSTLRALAGPARALARRVAPVLLDVAGLGFLVAGAALWAPIAGLVAAGVSCFVLQWRLTD